MTKKLIIMGILMIPFLLLTRVATAQDYSKLTPEVQAKMNQNKSEGKDIYTDVYLHYELEFGGVKDFASAKKLQELFAKNAEAINFFYNEENNHVSFVCPAKYNLKHFKSFISSEGFNINRTHKEEYSLDKN